MQDQADGPDYDERQKYCHGGRKGGGVEAVRRSEIGAEDQLVDEKQEGEERAAKPGELGFEKDQRVFSLYRPEPIFFVLNIYERDGHSGEDARQAKGYHRGQNDNAQLEAKEPSLRLPAVGQTTAS